MNDVFEIAEFDGKKVLFKYIGKGEVAVIPDGVTEIGYGAFRGCTSLKSVVIPEGVIEIGQDAFQGCSSLTSVVIPDGVKEIGSYAFEGCSLSEINLPESVQKINYAAFHLDQKVSEVSIIYRHGSTSCKGTPAFSGLMINLLDERRNLLAKLFSLDAEDAQIYDDFFGKLLCGGVQHLSEYDVLFTSWKRSVIAKGKLALTRLATPYELEEKYWDAYIDYVKKNERFIVPSIIINGDIEGLTTLESCGALVEKRIQDYIDLANKSQKTEILAFLMDYNNKHFGKPKELALEIKPSKLSDDWVTRKNDDGTLTITQYRGKDLIVEIPAKIRDKQVKNIGTGKPLKSIFFDHKELQAVKIQDGIQIINAGAFMDCNHLQSVEIPQSVVEIGKQAFFGCTNLTSIVIPEGVTEISEELFQFCGNLNDVVIPEGVTEFGQHAFGSCKSLTTVVIPEGVTEIRDNTFANCTDLISAVIPQSVTKIGSSAFFVCKSLTSVVIPEGVTEIGARAFQTCISLTTVVIPEGVTEIRDSTFAFCAGLISVVIPQSVTEIGSSAFFVCDSLTSVVIPDGVKKINEKTFSNCTSLTSVMIPDGLNSILGTAFKDCKSLNSILIPRSVKYIGSDSFNGCGDLVIQSPKGSYAIKFAKMKNIKFMGI